MEGLRIGTNAFRYVWSPVTTTLETRKYPGCSLCMWHFLHCDPAPIPCLSIIPGLRRQQTAPRSFPTESLSSSVLLSCPSGRIYGLRCGGTDPWASPGGGGDTSPHELVIMLPYQWHTFELTSARHHVSQHWLLTKVTALLYFGFVTCCHNERVIFSPE